jgi:hypothetical protein
MHIQQYATSGNLVAVGSFDGSLRVGDADTDAISEPFSGSTHDAAVTALYVSPDCRTIVSGTGLLPWMAHGTARGTFR